MEHPDRGAAVLHEFDLELRRGEVVVLAGPSGAGKSTAAALLLGLRRPDAGRVLVDGRDLTTLDPRAWRRQIGWLPQRPTMFRGTVRENIALGDPTARRSGWRQRRELAGVGGLRRRAPARLRRRHRARRPRALGRRAAPHRAGERPPARPALLVLDEPFAPLDPESTAVVARAIARIAPGRAVLVIEHDPHLLTVAHRTVSLPLPSTSARDARTTTARAAAS